MPPGMGNLPGPAAERSGRRECKGKNFPQIWHLALRRTTLPRSETPGARLRGMAKAPGAYAFIDRGTAALRSLGLGKAATRHPSLQTPTHKRLFQSTWSSRPGPIHILLLRGGFNYCPRARYGHKERIYLYRLSNAPVVSPSEDLCNLCGVHFQGHTLLLNNYAREKKL